MLKTLTTVSGAVEADLLQARLRGAGIPCERGPRSSRAGGHLILVEQEYLDRAREVLAEADGGFDEAELARLSDEAGQRWAQQHPVQPAVYPDEIGASDAAPAPAPAKKPRLRRMIGRLAGRETNTPDPFGR